MRPTARPPSVMGMRRRMPCSCISFTTWARSDPTSQATTSSDMNSDSAVLVGWSPWPRTARGKVAIGNNAREPLGIADQQRADVIVRHGARGLVGLGLAVEGEQTSFCESVQETSEPRDNRKIKARETFPDCAPLEQSPLRPIAFVAESQFCELAALISIKALPSATEGTKDRRDRSRQGLPRIPAAPQRLRFPRTRSRRRIGATALPGNSGREARFRAGR